MPTRTLLRRYCRQIKRLLPCHGKQTKAILTEIKANLTAFLAEAPETELSAVEARFGTPQAVAAAYVEDLDTEALLRGLRIRRRIVTIVASILISALLLWVGAVIWAAHVHIEESHYVTEVTIRETPNE